MKPVSASTGKPYSCGLVWLRRDLRIHDQPALAAALQECRQVHCLFVLDNAILDPLPRTDRRIAFILTALAELDANLRRLAGKAGAGLIVRHGPATILVPDTARTLGAEVVYAARDYEPQARARDAEVSAALTAQGCRFYIRKDHVVFEEREVLTGAGKPYTVFTPYKRAWLARIDPADLVAHDPHPHARALAERPPAWRHPPPTLTQIGFAQSESPPPTELPSPHGAQDMLAAFFERMDDYHRSRDFPASEGASRLGVHLRFGTLSIRQVVSLALQRIHAGSEGAATWLSELIWRDFYFQLLANFPHVASGSFRREYDAIRWEQGQHGDVLFQAWCEGRTGYPIVDAAMYQLNRTGYMHNRLRMVSASFLVKDLGVDWRRGEAYFAEKLNDFDLAANNGGWQWVASSGCDAQPWFRIFNPVSQSQKFDPEGRFIRHYLPQLAALPTAALHAPWLAAPLELAAAGVVLGRDYPHPLVDHAQARLRTLERYGVVRSTAVASASNSASN